MMKNKEPLVSIIVVTYNSSEYVFETLESIKNQSYKNIELVISDDCSTDDTVDICQRWIDKNRHYFKNGLLISAVNNAGVPHNCNKGIKNAQGEWIKIIAGDDLLMPESIQNYVSSISPEKEFLVGKMQSFSINKNGHRVYGQLLPIEKNLSFFDLSPSLQHAYLLTKSFNFAPATFFKKELLRKHGYFFERYKYLEDIPYWLHLTSKGIKIYLVEVATVLYRTKHESLVFTKKTFYNIKFMECIYTFRKEKVYPEIPFWNFFYYQNEFVEKLRYYVISRLLRNRRNKFTILVDHLLSTLSFQYVLEKIKYFFL